MSLSDNFELAKQMETRSSSPCSVYKIKQSMTDEDAKFFDKILYDRAISPRVVVQTLKNAAYDSVSDQIVRRHRLGQCGTCRQP